MKLSSAAVIISMAVCAFFIPFFSAVGSGSADIPAVPQKEPEDTVTENPAPPFFTVSSEKETADFDKSHSIKLKNGDGISDVSIYEYLVGCVAAEMPAGFGAEALKAQAVAARTYLLYKTGSPSPEHPEADICGDSSCCAAWASDGALHEKWGDGYDKYIDIIKNAVSETDGLYLSYEGAPALAVFHSSSAGSTESSGAVWNKETPYLKSVASPENIGAVPNYVFTLAVSTQEFKDTVKERFPNADLTVSPLLNGTERTESGRVASVKIGGETVSGTELRSMFGLRSTYLNIEETESEVIFTSVGYGHGVGMSQYGANTMAKNGSSFEDILAWYYPGTELKNAAAISFERSDNTSA